MTFSENKSLRHPFQEGPAIHSEARKTWTLNSACSASPGQTAIISFFVELHIYMNLRIKTKFLLFVSSVLMSLMSCNTLIKSVMPFCCSSCYYRLWFKKKKNNTAWVSWPRFLGLPAQQVPGPWAHGAGGMTRLTQVDWPRSLGPPVQCVFVSPEGGGPSGVQIAWPGVLGPTCAVGAKLISYHGTCQTFIQLIHSASVILREKNYCQCCAENI